MFTAILTAVLTNPTVLAYLATGLVAAGGWVVARLKITQAQQDAAGKALDILRTFAPIVAAAVEQSMPPGDPVAKKAAAVASLVAHIPADLMKAGKLDREQLERLAGVALEAAVHALPPTKPTETVVR